MCVTMSIISTPRGRGTNWNRTLSLYTALYPQLWISTFCSKIFSSFDWLLELAARIFQMIIIETGRRSIYPVYGVSLNGSKNYEILESYEMLLSVLLIAKKCSPIY